MTNMIIQGALEAPSPELAAEETGWTPPRAALLRLHYALGLTAAVSAELIGGVTRNAVVSKRRRLGLRGANPAKSCAAPATAPLTGTQRFAWRRFDSPDQAPGGEPLPFMDAPAPPGADPKTLAKRRLGECGWPLGAAEAPGSHRTLFCCAPVVARRSYCAVHMARAYEAPVPQDEGR